MKPVTHSVRSRPSFTVFTAQHNQEGLFSSVGLKNRWVFGGADRHSYRTWCGEHKKMLESAINITDWGEHLVAAVGGASGSAAIYVNVLASEGNHLRPWSQNAFHSQTNVGNRTITCKWQQSLPLLTNHTCQLKINQNNNTSVSTNGPVNNSLVSLFLRLTLRQLKL